MTQNQLIIFAKNTEKGKVKTRLAKDIGDDQALLVYQKLLGHTLQVIAQVPDTDKALYYDSYIPQQDSWKNAHYQQYVQQGLDLGDRMFQAFSAAFKKGYKRVVLIGTDCPELLPEHIQTTFTYLQKEPVVIGPAKDGGYYLIGTTEPLKALFYNKTWSSPLVLQQTLGTLQAIKRTALLLPTLFDLDDVHDLALFPHFGP
ncbi:TIGR04282 family arsenosugar biosynthesis glycosyltransferase [Pontibacter sp. 13R65]|uniref:TIGR04282 family arsenosugar biosynthesis glycosyltransferase n=1 Tax=Pontibacter sp. 13R65 TaxID=3127458 RepID=UPI00301D3309